MVRIDCGRYTIDSGLGSTTWENGWLLMAGVRQSGRGRSEDVRRAVVAAHTDGRWETLNLDQSDTDELRVFRLVVEPEPESRRPPLLRRGQRVDVGAGFGPKYGGVVNVIRTDPLRAGRRLPHPDARYCFHSTRLDVGPLTVVSAEEYAGHQPDKRWCPTRVRDAIETGIKAAGKTGVLIYNRDTTDVRVLDVGGPVMRCEVRPDGLVAAAIVRHHAFQFEVVFFDLGDD